MFLNCSPSTASLHLDNGPILLVCHHDSEGNWRRRRESVPSHPLQRLGIRLSLQDKTARDGRMWWERRDLAANLESCMAAHHRRGYKRPACGLRGTYCVHGTWTRGRGTACLHVISLFLLSHFVGLVADSWTGTPRQGPQGSAHVIGTGLFCCELAAMLRPLADAVVCHDVQ